jgi:hypothetical protein
MYNLFYISQMQTSPKTPQMNWMNIWFTHAHLSKGDQDTLYVN